MAIPYSLNLYYKDLLIFNHLQCKKYQIMIQPNKEKPILI